MKRYIEVNTLIQDIERSRANNNHNNAIASQTHTAEHRHFIKMVLDQPTADVIEVVRCKDCQHYINGKCYVSNRTNKGLYPRVNIHSRNENDYCSYGERGTHYRRP